MIRRYTVVFITDKKTRKRAGRAPNTVFTLALEYGGTFEFELSGVDAEIFERDVRAIPTGKVLRLYLREWKKGWAWGYIRKDKDCLCACRYNDANGRCTHPDGPRLEDGSGECQIRDRSKNFTFCPEPTYTVLKILDVDIVKRTCGTVAVFKAVVGTPKGKTETIELDVPVRKSRGLLDAVERFHAAGKNLPVRRERVGEIDCWTWPDRPTAEKRSEGM